MYISLCTLAATAAAAAASTHLQYPMGAVPGCWLRSRTFASAFAVHVGCVCTTALDNPGESATEVVTLKYHHTQPLHTSTHVLPCPACPCPAQHWPALPYKILPRACSNCVRAYVRACGPGGGLTLVRRRRGARNTVETFTVKGVKIFLALWMADFPGRSRP